MTTELEIEAAEKKFREYRDPMSAQDLAWAYIEMIDARKRDKEERGKILTKEWFESIPNRRAKYLVVLFDHIGEKLILDDGYNGIVFAINPTRGQVLDLLSALGIKPA